MMPILTGATCPLVFTAVKVGADHGDASRIVLPLPVVSGEGGVLLNHVLYAPVKFMVAKGYGVVSHPVQGNIDRPSFQQVGHAGALVEVSAVYQQKPASVCAPQVVRFVGDIGQAIVEGVVRIGDIAMQIRGLEQGKVVVSGWGRFRCGTGGGGCAASGRREERRRWIRLLARSQKNKDHQRYDTTPLHYSLRKYKTSFSVA